MKAAINREILTKIDWANKEDVSDEQVVQILRILYSEPKVNEPTLKQRIVKTVSTLSNDELKADPDVQKAYEEACKAFDDARKIMFSTATTVYNGIHNTFSGLFSNKNDNNNKSNK